jgi:putative ABC transport system permease protein
MFDRDLYTEILQVILRNPMRALLSGIGVSWGLFMIIITVGSARGLENGVKADMENRANNSMFMWSQQTSMPYKGFRKGRYFEINLDDVAYLKEQVAGVEDISPRNSLGGYRGANNVIYKTKSGAFNVYGDFPQYIKIEPVDIWKGRYINPLDIEEKRKVCVIGDRVNQLLFGKEEAIGEHVQINGVNFKVVGIYKSFKKGEDAEEDTQSIFIPFTTFQKAFNYGDQVGWMSILIKEDGHTDQTVENILATLKSRKSIHPDDPRAFGYWTMMEELEDMNLIFSGFNIVAIVFGLLALFAGIIGISNIMLITIKERTKEFGVRRSLGATPFVVIRQVIMETVFLTFVAGLGGMIFGVFSLEGVNMLLESMGDAGSFRNPSIDWRTVVSVLGVMVVMGGLAGLLPAFIAVTIKPVEALRTE